jgi:hypothetical protein
MHVELHEWLNKLKEIQLRIVFAANKDDNDENNIVIRHFMAINEKQDEALMKSALHDWYKQDDKNYAEWAKQYPVDSNQSTYSKVEMQRSWCIASAIRVTPTIHINGHLLPRSYQIQEIKYLVIS